MLTWEMSAFCLLSCSLEITHSSSELKQHPQHPQTMGDSEPGLPSGCFAHLCINKKAVLGRRKSMLQIVSLLPNQPRALHERGWDTPRLLEDRPYCCGCCCEAATRFQASSVYAKAR